MGHEKANKEQNESTKDCTVQWLAGVLKGKGGLLQGFIPVQKEALK